MRDRSLGLGQRTRRDSADGLHDRADVVGRRSAAAADQVDEAAGRELSEESSGRLRSFVVAAKRVRQSGVRMGAGVKRRNRREFREKGAHLRRAERAVDSHGDRVRMGDRGPERVHGLPRERSATAVGDRDRDHQRKRNRLLVEEFEHRGDRRLRVEGVEDGLDQQDVDAPFDQGARLLAVGGVEPVKGQISRRGVVDIGRNRERLGRGPERARHEARLPWCSFRPARRTGCGDLCRAEVQLVDERLHPVIGLGDRVGAEGVGLGDVRARFEERVVDFRHQRGLAEYERFVVALQLRGMVGQALAAKIGFGRAAALDHGSHRAIENEDSLGEQLFEFGAAVDCSHRRFSLESSVSALQGFEYSKLSMNLNTLIY